ncbi:DUF2845 domain-containing protein [Vibrio sp. DW001]|uniref:DUF2845 domain-containing protein n=1 Tax=Vibrio sp. DW001 TaxID=2912315 RepID=UPI0023B0F121|nr:DUF2845 domain-containing protein [Vibrio sp. DW001]WED28118.1 DUF2845 domain-containing protein [Vibrio sp. DW001]
MSFWEFLVIVVVFAIFFNVISTRQRRKRLMAKYRNEHIVNRLMKKTFWQGQTKDELIDSLGKPQDISQKVLKTKTKEIWKYNKSGKNRYGLKITIENGLVIGWDQK